MHNNEILMSLVGKWQGTCRTWFEPGKLADESTISGEITPILNGSFVRHVYESFMQGKPRAGEETFAFNAITQKFQCVWMDDFHMNYALLISEGESTAAGFTVVGKYDISPNDPQWSWKTVYELVDDNHLVISAYNIIPGEEEALAVEIRYQRVIS